MNVKNKAACMAGNWVWSVVLLAVGAMLAAGGCSKDQASGGAGAGAARGGAGRPVPVSAVEARKQAFPIQINTFGNVEAASTVTIQPQVTGMLTKVNFKKGEYLRKDRMLFEIDPRPLEANLKQAQANKARDQAAADNTKQDLARVGELLKKKIASQDEYDKAQAAVDGLEAALRADQAAVDTITLQLANCFIASPIDGRAGDLEVNAGNLVTASVTPMVVIKQVRPIEVHFSIPQTDLWAVRKQMLEGKMKVVVTIPDEDAREEGELTFVDNVIDKSTGMVMLAATLPNDSERLWPGQYVNVSLTLSVQADAIVVPSQAVQTGREGKYVFVLIPTVTDGKSALTADFRAVTVGPVREGLAVIDKGVAADELVVTDGQLSLLPGKTAELKELASPPASGPSAPRGSAPYSAPAGEAK